jgi:two-component system, chemotaxis family, response regulator Rcp1
VLLVDDDASDRMLVQKILESCDNKIKLDYVDDGEEALLFLKREAPYEDADRPDLLLLDLNLPGRDGGDVLSAIRADPELTSLPVVIFSTSKAPADIRNCYVLRANAFVTKPGDLKQFRAAVEGLYAFWFGVARLPND